MSRRRSPQAKLDWVGSANLVENFPELTLTAEQRAVAQRFDDPLLRELVKDMCLDRSLRHDVYRARGAAHEARRRATRPCGMSAGAEHQPRRDAVRG